MAAIRSCSSTLVQPLSADWQCTRSAAGSAAAPDQLDSLDWIPACVPGTFAAALRAAGRWDGESQLELDGDDIWYRCGFAGGGEEILRFEGLATIAEVWLNGDLLLRSESMFVPQQIAVRTQASNELHICFRSLDAWLRPRRGRQHWRPRLARPSSLRHARTTLLGRMPGWCPTVHAVGPWRPVLREHRSGPFGVEAIDISTAVFDREGRMVVRAVLDCPVQAEAVAEVDKHSARLTQTAPNEFQGVVSVPDANLWWPHTHGVPHLHQAMLRIGDVTCDLGVVGFRTVENCADEADGFAVAINGERIFCRGACWTSADLVALPGDARSYRPWLLQARDAGMNMIRVSGITLYESDSFFALCDELGLMVWQDAMLANFDYPADEEFHARLAAELTQWLHRTQSNPSLVAFCGGSEVFQQAVMLGVPADRIDTSLYDDFIPRLLRTQRPDLLYVTNSPSGGAWPFQPDSGVTHYYGVGAYLRPLDDARRANVRFASECLALANVPDSAATDALAVATVTDPRWKRGVPRDPGAGWDFDDVRDHYMARLFGIDPVQLRWTDFQRYLELSRAVSCILMEQVFAEWRRGGSDCAGGLVWQLQDVVPGAGWGVIDAAGRPKPAWYALRRAFRTRQVLLTDEGLNGLHVHLLNEADRPLHARLDLACMKSDGRIVRDAKRAATVPPRGACRLRSSELLPEFFDISFAYRFGPPLHDITVASLVDQENDCVIAESVHFPTLGAAPYLLPTRDIGLEVTVERDAQQWSLSLQSRGFAQFLQIEDTGFRPEDNWLHLPPGQIRRIRLHPTSPNVAIPNGEVRALNADRTIRYVGKP